MAKKQEAESNLADFVSWIWGNLNAGQAGLDIMALASRKECKIQKSGTFPSLREVISWKLTVDIQSVEDKRKKEEQEARSEVDQRAWLSALGAGVLYNREKTESQQFCLAVAHFLA